MWTGIKHRVVACSVVLAVLALGGCHTIEENPRTAIGVGAGGVAGALIGEEIDDDGPEGAIIGGIAGALIGGGIGQYLDRRAARRAALEAARTNRTVWMRTRNASGSGYGTIQATPRGQDARNEYVDVKYIDDDGNVREERTVVVPRQD
jgi:uncharacterized protein YcfJ